MHKTQNTKQQIKEINQLINEYNKNTDENEKSEIVKKLKYLINDPITISNTEHLAEGNVLKNKSRIIADAFESITNGMQNPDAYEKLSEISGKSVFHDWKILINIIDNIYKNRFTEAMTLISTLSADSCVSRIRPVLAYLADTENKPPDEAADFLNSITGSENESVRNFADIEASLKEQNWEIFIDVSILLINEMLSNNKKTAIQLAMWCIKKIYSNEYHAGTFISNLKFIFGEAETFRIIALSLLGENIELSLFFWIKSTISRLENASIGFFECREYLNIINEIYSEYINNPDITKNYTESLNDILKILENRINISNVENKDKLPALKSCKSSNEKPPVKTIKAKPSEAVQLELF